MNLEPMTFPIYGRIARISRPKLDCLGTHDGVQLPDGRVVHMTVDANTRICSFSEFAAGRAVKLEYVVPQALHRQAFQILNEQLTRNAPYNVLDYNCEIFARTVVLQAPTSPQVGFWLAIGTVVSLWILTKRSVTV